MKEEPRTVTFEELQERLRKRIELLRSKRHADAAASTAKVAKDWQTGKKIDSQKRSRKNKSLEDPIEADRSPSKRPKRESKSTVVCLLFHNKACCLPCPCCQLKYYGKNPLVGLSIYVLS